MTSGDASTEERVVPCLECGAILPFDADTCVLCGAVAVGEEGREEAVKPCLACEALIPEDDFFCAECGDFALTVTQSEHAPVQRLGAREGRVTTFLARLVTAVVLMAALIMVVTIVVETISQG